MWIGGLLSELEVNVPAAVEPFTRTESLCERVDEKAIAMDCFERTLSPRPLRLSRENIDAHCVENFGVVCHAAFPDEYHFEEWSQQSGSLRRCRTI
jgi:hypothetical protein